MKTTVEIEDRLFEQAKREALRRKTTLRCLIEAGLRNELKRPPTRKKFKLRDGSFKGGGGLMPGIDFSNWEQIRSIMYEGHGG